MSSDPIILNPNIRKGIGLDKFKTWRLIERPNPDRKWWQIWKRRTIREMAQVPPEHTNCRCVIKELV